MQILWENLVTSALLQTQRRAQSRRVFIVHLFMFCELARRGFVQRSVFRPGNSGGGGGVAYVRKIKQAAYNDRAAHGQHRMHVHQIPMATIVLPTNVLTIAGFQTRTFDFLNNLFFKIRFGGNWALGD